MVSVLFSCVYLAGGSVCLCVGVGLGQSVWVIY